MGQPSLFHPFQFYSHQLAKCQSHIASDGFYGITHLFRKSTRFLSGLSYSFLRTKYRSLLNRLILPGYCFSFSQSISDSFSFSTRRDCRATLSCSAFVNAFPANSSSKIILTAVSSRVSYFLQMTEHQNHRMGRTIPFHNSDMPCSTPETCPHPHNLLCSPPPVPLLNKFLFCRYSLSSRVSLFLAMGNFFLYSSFSITSLCDCCYLYLLSMGVKPMMRQVLRNGHIEVINGLKFIY